MSCESRNYVVAPSLDMVANRPYFGPKQVHRWSHLKMGVHLMLHSAKESPEGGDVQIIDRNVKVVGISGCKDSPIVFLEVQSSDREPHVIWKTPQQLGLVPLKGMWSAREWLSYCKK